MMFVALCRMSWRDPDKIRYAPGVWRHNAPGRITGKKLNKARKHAAMMQSKLDGDFA
jgi:hypothetical protein